MWVSVMTHVHALCKKMTLIPTIQYIHKHGVHAPTQCTYENQPTSYKVHNLSRADTRKHPNTTNPHYASVIRSAWHAGM